MSRRWRAGWKHTEAGVPFRVVEGRKEPGDLRLEWLTPDSGWVPVTMATAAILVDFFCDNEDHLSQFRPHWQESGSGYFLKRMGEAPTLGWQAVAENLRNQRERLATARTTTSTGTDDFNSPEFLAALDKAWGTS